jgi:hypothetical protein
MAARFPRVETRRRVGKFVLGLLADLPRKNCWAIAEHAGDADPHGMQHLLARASWDTDGVREDLRDDVIGALGDDDGVQVVDLCRYRDYAAGAQRRRRSRLLSTRNYAETQRARTTQKTTPITRPTDEHRRPRHRQR